MMHFASIFLHAAAFLTLYIGTSNALNFVGNLSSTINTVSSTSQQSSSTTQQCGCEIDSEDYVEYIWLENGTLPGFGSPTAVPTHTLVVATVTTLVFQYDNTAVTSYETVINSNFSIAKPWITVVQGPNFTDAYGTIHMSPTPVIHYENLTVINREGPIFTADDGFFECSNLATTTLTAAPSGVYINDVIGPAVFDPAPLEDFVTWIASNLPSGAPSSFSTITECGSSTSEILVVIHNQPPSLHSLVSLLTAAATSTSSILGNFPGASSIQTSPAAVPPSLTPPTPAPTRNSGAPGLPSFRQENDPSSPSRQLPSTQPSGVAAISSSGSNSGVENNNDGSSSGNPSGGSSSDQAPGAGNESPEQSSPLAFFTISGGSTVFQNSASAFVVDGMTLNLGATITVDNGASTLILPSSGGTVFINGVTQAIQDQATLPTSVITIGSTEFIRNSDGDLIHGSQTLAPGGVITADGTTISLEAGGSLSVVNGATQTLIAGTTSVVPHLITIGSSTFTENGDGDFVIGSQTLIPGGLITEDGTTISLASDDGSAVVNGATQSLRSISTTEVFGGSTQTGFAAIQVSKATLHMSRTAVWKIVYIILLSWLTPTIL